MQWGLIFRFYISTKWLSYRNISFLPTAEICHHGNLLSLEGWDALGKYVATTSEIVTQTEFHFSSLSLTSMRFLHPGHCSCNQIRERLYGFKLCFLFLKGAVFGAFSSLSQLAPSFPGCRSKPVWLSRSCWTALCSDTCSVTYCCWGKAEILNWGPSSSAVGSILLIYWPQYTHSSILFCLTYMSENNFRP